ncbi:MAG TPA: YraN family protein [Candidatus Limnocylindrales bacterium]|nr:YraN family protein [Candidatus Limnocylindrales bacterium]
MRTAAQASGDAAERLVAAQLEAIGWRVLARQVRVGRAELDLVAIDPGPPPALVIVEVRARSRRDFGLPEETVDHRKLRRIQGGVFRLLEAGELPDGRRLPRLPVRIDVVALDLDGNGRAATRHHRAIGG